MERRGRKSQYKAKVEPFLEEIAIMLENGATNKQVAQELGISERSIYTYATRYPKFRQVLNQAKEAINLEVESAMLKMCTGYEVEEVETITSACGEKTTKHKTKYITPSVSAQKFWLINRDRDNWSTQAPEEEIPINSIIVKRASDI